jgi:hypothetical protein
MACVILFRFHIWSYSNFIVETDFYMWVFGIQMWNDYVADIQTMSECMIYKRFQLISTINMQCIAYSNKSIFALKIWGSNKICGDISILFTYVKLFSNLLYCKRSYRMLSKRTKNNDNIIAFLYQSLLAVPICRPLGISPGKRYTVLFMVPSLDKK